MKKLLYIILFVPFALFGQSDKLIFSSGDTLMVNIIEVGVKEIKYTHLGEDLNYSINRNKIIKIIHDSGRVDIINSRLSDKLDNPDKKKRFDYGKLPFNRSFEVGFLGGLSFNSIRRGKWHSENIKESGIIMALSGLFIEYNLSEKLILKSKLLYQKKGVQSSMDYQFTDNVGNPIAIVEVTEKYTFDYFTLPVLVQMGFNHKNWSMFPNVGLFVGLQNKSHTVAEGFSGIVVQGGGSMPDEIVETYKEQLFDFGVIFGLGFSYRLNSKFKIQFELTFDNSLIRQDLNSIIFPHNIVSGLTYSRPMTFGLSYKI